MTARDWIFTMTKQCHFTTRIRCANNNPDHVRKRKPLEAAVADGKLLVLSALSITAEVITS